MTSPEFSPQTPDYAADLERVFGQYASQLLEQVRHDNPALSQEEVLEQAWSLIPEATAYMEPASKENLTNQAILIHEDYEAHRRVATD